MIQGQKHKDREEDTAHTNHDQIPRPGTTTRYHDQIPRPSTTTRYHDQVPRPDTTTGTTTRYHDQEPRPGTTTRYDDRYHNQVPPRRYHQIFLGQNVIGAKCYWSKIIINQVPQPGTTTRYHDQVPQNVIGAKCYCCSGGQLLTRYHDQVPRPGTTTRYHDQVPRPGTTTRYHQDVMVVPPSLRPSRRYHDHLLCGAPLPPKFPCLVLYMTGASSGGQLLTRYHDQVPRPDTTKRY